MWKNGFALSQTLWTCLYLHQPHELVDDPILMGSIYMMLRRVNLMRKNVLKVGIFDVII